MSHSLRLKRLFDLLIASMMLLALSPFILMIAVLIRFDSAGTIFFRQQRLGQHGQPFYILKFRTMVDKAEQIGTGIVSLADDPRITRMGHFLRRTSLDEIPQLWNVVIGDMSLVGPRPPVVYHPYPGYDNYPSWTKRRFDMKPGITGLSQLSVRNTVAWDERIKIDVQYVDNFDILTDILILLKTVIQVFHSDLFIVSEEVHHHDQEHPTT